MAGNGHYQPVPRTWWVLPFFGGALAVIVVAAAVTVALHTSRTAHRAGVTATPAKVSPAAPAPLPAQMFPDALYGQLTAAVQGGDEAALLSLAAPGAKPALRTWWENLQAIGFTTGAVLPTASHGMVRLDRQGNGSTVVLAGAHSPLDPSDATGKPDVPLERYKIGLHFASPTATGQITSWQPLGGAPWDEGAKLYVRKTAHVVVAGLPAESALVDEVLPLAETAANYDVSLLSHVNFQDLHQQGFIVFVSGDPTVRDRWLAATSQPKGWPPGLFGARVFQLPGPGVSTDQTPAGGIADGTTGGARVVVAPPGKAAGQPHMLTVTLVRDFMLDILAAHDQEFVNGIALAPVPSWSEQGLAVAVQTLFEANTNPAPARYDFGPLTTALHALPAGAKTGTLPGTAQLFGPPVPAANQNWQEVPPGVYDANEVAASVYAYIERTYGINQMFAAATLLYTRFATPFGNVLKSHRGGAYLFYQAATVKAGWRAWLART
jgi:hypothetical protein